MSRAGPGPTSMEVLINSVTVVGRGKGEIWQQLLCSGEGQAKKEIITSK